MNDLSDYEWERAEALAQKQKQRRIFANHMRHPDPRDPDHIDDDDDSDDDSDDDDDDNDNEEEDDELETCN